MRSSSRITLAIFTTAALATGCNQATPPASQPDAPPPAASTTAVVSGTLPDWKMGKAFATLSGALTFRLYSDGEDTTYHDVKVFAPVYQGPVAADGSFRIELSDPDPSLLFPLGCTADGPDIAGVGLLVASDSTTLEDGGS